VKALETAAKHIHSIIGVRCPSKNFKAGCITFLFSTSAALSPPGIYVRSSLLQKGDGVLQLQQARHPCVELIDGVNFIPNDYDLKKGTSDFQKIMTGPNIGGKSTFVSGVSPSLGCKQACVHALLLELEGFRPTARLHVCRLPIGDSSLTNCRVAGTRTRTTAW